MLDQRYIQKFSAPTTALHTLEILKELVVADADLTFDRPLAGTVLAL